MKPGTHWIALTALFLHGPGAPADEPDDRSLIARFAAERDGRSAAAVAAETPPAVPQVVNSAAAGADALGAEERRARAEVALAQVRLELVLARKAIQASAWREAATHALEAQRWIRQLPAGVDGSVWDLQAEGVLAKAQRAGVKVEAIKPAVRVAGAAAEQPSSPPAGPTSSPSGAALAPAVPVDSTAAARPGAAAMDAKPSGSERSAAVFELETEADIDEARLQYERQLYNAYKSAEVRSLIEADEARVPPVGEIGFAPNWPQIVAGRSAYAGGAIARSDPWTDKDGTQWYAALYDIRDLTYEVPDFAPALTGDITEDRRNALDRDALRRGSAIFNGDADDLACGLPLLRYFGGVDDMEFRGPKYSVEKQKQIMEQIRAFTTRRTEATIIPLGAP